MNTETREWSKNFTDWHTGPHYCSVPGRAHIWVVMGTDAAGRLVEVCDDPDCAILRRRFEAPARAS